MQKKSAVAYIRFRVRSRSASELESGLLQSGRSPSSDSTSARSLCTLHGDGALKGTPKKPNHDVIQRGDRCTWWTDALVSSLDWGAVKFWSSLGLVVVQRRQKRPSVPLSWCTEHLTWRRCSRFYNGHTQWCNATNALKMSYSRTALTFTEYRVRGQMIIFTARCYASAVLAMGGRHCSDRQYSDRHCSDRHCSDRQYSSMAISHLRDYLIINFWFLFINRRLQLHPLLCYQYAETILFRLNPSATSVSGITSGDGSNLKVGGTWRARSASV